MERITVQSSNIISIGYDSTSSTLEVEFTSSGVYQYFGVPENVYQDLMNASSKGKYFAQNIKNVYPCGKG
jgi:hypothetical protein